MCKSAACSHGSAGLTWGLAFCAVTWVGNAASARGGGGGLWLWLWLWRWPWHCVGGTSPPVKPSCTHTQCLPHGYLLCRSEDKPGALLYLVREVLPADQPTIVFTCESAESSCCCCSVTCHTAHGNESHCCGFHCWQRRLLRPASSNALTAAALPSSLHALTPTCIMFPVSCCCSHASPRGVPALPAGQGGHRLRLRARNHGPGGEWVAIWLLYSRRIISAQP